MQWYTVEVLSWLLIIFSVLAGLFKYTIKAVRNYERKRNDNDSGNEP